MLNPGTATSSHKTIAHRVLLVAVVFSLALFLPHAIRPVETSRVYVPLMAVLLAVNVAALWWVKRRPSIAFQSYWWAALVVVAVMTAFNAQRGGRNLPMIVALPPIATVAIRWLVSLRAASVYGVGVLGLLVPSSFLYPGDWGRIGGLACVVVAAVTIGSGLLRQRQGGLDAETLDGMREMNAELERQKAANESSKAISRE